MNVALAVPGPRPAAMPTTGSVVFTSDLLKVDDRLAQRVPNPQRINIEWIHALFAPVLRNITGRPGRLFAEEDHPNPLARLSVYRRLGREFSSRGWASLYEGLGDRDLEDEVAGRFANSLVVAFEMPPYLERILRRNGIGFVDLTIHPIRFLPDYMFGVRSNIAEVSARLHETAVPPEIFAEFARISAARSVRTYRNNLPEAGSAVFLGQIEIDSSLIHRGRLHGDEDVEDALLGLLGAHETVYYKAHPHRQNLDQHRRLVESLPRCRWMEVNIYELLARPEVELIASLSSGALHEAAVFGRRTRACIDRPLAFDLAGAPHDQVFAAGQYVAAPPAVFSEAYWAYALGASDVPPDAPGFDPCAGALKTTLNMKWGR